MPTFPDPIFIAKEWYVQPFCDEKITQLFFVMDSEKQNKQIWYV